MGTLDPTIKTAIAKIAIAKERRRRSLDTIDVSFILLSDVEYFL